MKLKGSDLRHHQYKQHEYHPGIWEDFSSCLLATFWYAVKVALIITIVAWFVLTVLPHIVQH